MSTPQTEELPRTYRWNLWQRQDGTTFLSLGHPRDPVEREQLLRTFESENWQTAAQEAFGSAPEIDAALGPLVGVLHQFPSVLMTTAKLEDTQTGPRHAVIGLTIDTVFCLRWLLRALAAITPRHRSTPWELVVQADQEWMRKLPPNGIPLTLKLCLHDADLASLADFADDLSEQTPLAEILRNAQRQSAQDYACVTALPSTDAQESDASQPTRKEDIMDNREQPAPEVTAQDIERWLDSDRERLRRLEARGLPLPDELLEAEIAMVRATIGQFEAELRYLAVVARQRRIKA